MRRLRARRRHWHRGSDVTQTATVVPRFREVADLDPPCGRYGNLRNPENRRAACRAASTISWHVNSTQSSRGWLDTQVGTIDWWLRDLLRARFYARRSCRLRQSVKGWAGKLEGAKHVLRFK